MNNSGEIGEISRQNRKQRFAGKNKKVTPQAGKTEQQEQKQDKAMPDQSGRVLQGPGYAG